MYENLEVDHIFRIVEDDADAINQISSLGFSPSEIREHTEQGTSSRFIFFEKNYLELIYLRSREESQNNFVKFHQRVDNFRNKSGSPYGIAFRGKLSEIEKKDFELYQPKYNLSGKSFTIYMHSSYFTNPEMPAIFFLEVNNSTKEEFYPINRGLSCEKDLSLNQFTDVVLISPILKEESFGNFEIQKGDEEKLLINGKFSF
ncbi:MAG: VOC family protein [Okeania sp. SIO3H1]|uniref:VOC family protein n=1 Tax=Okeania sp. SIO1I7 TaxID=2607772 RepID=UPI0013C8E499|nr:VOC family protein [Okeania sp. SIO1I7]NEN87847.1 VOC family protein [Okeania sp. SIO3H1]NET26248.1 VOC family protein [Okeania sp. SIO1I7]